MARRDQDYDDLDQYLGGTEYQKKAKKPAPQRAQRPQPQRAQSQSQSYDDLDQYLGGAPVRTRAKPRRRKVVIIVVAVLLALLLGALTFAYFFVEGILEPRETGILKPQKLITDGYSKQDVVHILIVGIDNEEGRDYGAGLGLTDMLLYCRYNLKENQLNMLQIPRDSYVGENFPTNGTGKINALLISGPDKDNPINNLADSIRQQFQLPLDYYIALDMDAMKDIVNTFGGIKVYVPRNMSHDGSYLEQGWRWLDGDSAEFFVRNRYGEGFERGDIDRLDNQRHFYSALFRRFLNLTVQDINNLLPVIAHYCSTDLRADGDLIRLAISALGLSAENVVFCKAPGATGEGLDPTGQGRSNYYLDLYGRGTEEDPGLARLLNQYFRDPESPVEADALGLPKIKIPEGTALYPPNVQIMSSVQEGEGGAEVDVEPKPEDWAAFE